MINTCQTNKSNEAIDVAAAVIIDQNKVLLAKRDDGYLNNLWEFPGGKLESGESAKDAAKRELIEELEINVLPQSTLLTLEHDYPDKRVRLHFVMCLLEKQTSKYLNSCLQNEIAKWFQFDKLPLTQLCPADKIAATRISWHEINKKGEE